MSNPNEERGEGEISNQDLIQTQIESESKVEPEKSRSKQGKPGRNKGERGGKKGRDTRPNQSKKFQLNSAGLARHFLACRVCCYFFTGVQVLYGRSVVDRLVEDFDGRWLTVPLTSETRALMNKTFGLRLDIHESYVDFACEVCCRRFNVEVDQELETIVENELDNKDSNKQPQTAEEALPVRRSIEEQLLEWDTGESPLLKFEFKHRR